jgi:hypothetical protein
MSAPLKRIQDVLKELSDAEAKVNALLNVTDGDIDKMLTVQETPTGQVTTGQPTTPQTVLDAISVTAAVDAASYVTQRLAQMQQAAQNASDFLDAEAARIAALAFGTPKATARETGVTVRVPAPRAAKPPPTVPPEIYEAMMDAFAAIYYVFMAMMTGQVEYKATEARMWADELIKFAEFFSKVTVSGEGGS